MTDDQSLEDAGAKDGSICYLRVEAEAEIKEIKHDADPQQLQLDQLTAGIGEVKH